MTESPMLLSGDEIRRRQNDALLIDPFDPDRLNPNSYNLSLHHELLVYEEVVLDAAAPNRYRRLEIPSEGLTLQPNMLYLGPHCRAHRDPWAGADDPRPQLAGQTGVVHQPRR